MTLGERLDAGYRARSILSDAAPVALALLIDVTHEAAHGRPTRVSIYQAAEVFRWVANARDHVTRQLREESGLERRGDPCLPSW